MEGHAKEKQYQTNVMTNTLTSQKGLPPVLPLNIYHLSWEPLSIFMPWKNTSIAGQKDNQQSLLLKLKVCTAEPSFTFKVKEGKEKRKGGEKGVREKSIRAIIEQVSA